MVPLEQREGCRPPPGLVDCPPSSSAACLSLGLCSFNDGGNTAAAERLVRGSTGLAAPANKKVRVCPAPPGGRLLLYLVGRLCVSVLSEAAQVCSEESRQEDGV